MRPGFNICSLLVRRTALNGHERALRRLTLNRSTRLEMGAAPGSTFNPYVVKGAKAGSFENMGSGQICQTSGLWYPGSNLRKVNGRVFGSDMAPLPTPKEGEIG